MRLSPAVRRRVRRHRFWRLYRAHWIDYGRAVPFPLAHPAAVLPLRRYCPRVLSFPALVLGSLIPDTAYVFGDWDMDRFSHRFLGSFGYCLPAGLAALGLFHLLRPWLVGKMPAPYREALLPFSQRPIGSLWVVVISLMLGTWTHLLWDSFTHPDGWVVQHWSALQTPIVSLGNRTAKVCHVLSYGFSFAGVIYVFLVFEKWKQACAGRPAGASNRAMLWEAALAATLVLPIYLLRHLIHGRFGLFLTAVLCALVAAGVVLRIGKAPGDALRHKPGAPGRDAG